MLRNRIYIIFYFRKVEKEKNEKQKQRVNRSSLFFPGRRSTVMRFGPLAEKLDLEHMMSHKQLQTNRTQSHDD